MLKNQMAALNDVSENIALIHAKDLPIQNGTLTYGYTCDRDTVHVYVKDGVIHYVQYAKSGNGTHELKRHISGHSVAAEALKPEKRSYPEATLYAFAVMMIQAGSPLSLTAFDDRGRSNVDETVWEPNAMVL